MEVPGARCRRSVTASHHLVSRPHLGASAIVGPWPSGVLVTASFLKVEKQTLTYNFQNLEVTKMSLSGE